MMQKLGYCNLQYSEKQCTVFIEGSGEEVFSINGESNFKMSQDHRSTIIPVRNSFEEFNLEIFDIPQGREIPIFGNLRVFYRFSTEICLDGKFTKDPLETRKYSFDSDFQRTTTVHYLYGSPGRLVYRHGDGFFNQVRKKIISPHFILFKKREGINFQGKVYIGDAFLYQGILDSDGYFPFFIRRDDDERTERKTPLPKELVPA